VQSKTGILLVNLGSPSAPTPKAVRKYLAQFLSDRRVIELHPLLWRPILHGIILRTRPKKSAKLYAKIWNGNAEAPLIEISRAQRSALQKKFPANPIALAMRYGVPTIAKGLEELQQQGCTKIAILPLYPQYAGATTASVLDEVNKFGGNTEFKFLDNYHDDKGYISALAKSCKAHLAALDWQPDQILVSFHGLPKSSTEKGDPYEGQCNRTFTLLDKALKGIKTPRKLTFQSRFGPKQWLEPYTLTILENMAAAGQKNVVIIAPGFAADCLETLEELSISAKAAFLQAGGENFTVIPCLNDNPDHITALADIIHTRLLADG